jgi:glutamate synthase (NADPH/NADH) small chain
MEAEGVSFVLNTEADPRSLSAYDAVILCGGARKARSLNADHMDAHGIHYAVDYLTEATKAVLSGKAPGISARQKHVVVVGGGDTGNDCVGTALRQGCACVTQLEMMPAAPDFRACGNPWPEWPRILRTDYGQLEAIAVQGSDPRIYETTVESIHVSEKNEITALTTVRLTRNPEGRMGPVPGTQQVLPCEMLLIAAGFVGCEDKTLSAFSLKADPRGRLLPENGSHHVKDSLFSAGDMRTGQSLVVRALADGREAAREADAFLHGKYTD